MDRSGHSFRVSKLCHTIVILCSMLFVTDTLLISEAIGLVSCLGMPASSVAITKCGTKQKHLNIKLD